MVDSEKIRVLAEINKAMLNAGGKLEESLKKRDNNAVLQLKSYIAKAQKKFEISIQNLK